jgi:hypothetical protein
MVVLVQLVQISFRFVVSSQSAPYDADRLRLASMGNAYAHRTFSGRFDYLFEIACVFQVGRNLSQGVAQDFERLAGLDANRPEHVCSGPQRLDARRSYAIIQFFIRRSHGFLQVIRVQAKQRCSSTSWP